eukprot:TRINITY_DN19449_c0_g1_i3.p1 TRINITY_DN19449_c0_g1~~TRINITY_DN19449_c0_g1_i3.p1  ORF type:complete len:197 (+),score=31.48 TRINITY_DN19449_c0_g1_i3:181-771(+)
MVHDGHLLGSGDWSEVVLAGSRVHPEVQKLCPATIQIVSQIEEALDCAMTGVGEVIFSRLAPGSHIKPHCASSNLRLTCHLGLEVPDGCEIRVGDEIRQWQDKKCLWFDDSFEHEVWQRSSSHRIVLLIRFWHPDIGKPNWRQAQETLNAGYLNHLASQVPPVLQKSDPLESLRGYRHVCEQLGAAGGLHSVAQGV